VSARLRENGWTDLHEIFREGVEWPWDDLIKFWVNSGKQVSGSKEVNLFVITGHSSGLALTSQYHSLGGSRGEVCCASHHSLLLLLYLLIVNGDCICYVYMSAAFGFQGISVISVSVVLLLQSRLLTA